jgi:hypothetical protein
MTVPLYKRKFRDFESLYLAKSCFLKEEDRVCSGHPRFHCFPHQFSLRKGST